MAFWSTLRVLFCMNRVWPGGFHLFMKTLMVSILSGSEKNEFLFSFRYGFSFWFEEIFPGLHMDT